MNAPVRLSCLLALAACALLSWSAVALAGEGAGAGTGSTQASTPSTPETTSSIAVSETPTAPTTSSSTPAPATGTTPAPGASRTPAAPAAPLVRARRPQKGTPSLPRHGAKGAPAVVGAGKNTKGAQGARPNGPRPPSPSALTPPLPLAFSASLSGIPTFFIESFRIPPFLLPIFQAAGTAYGVPWQVLAAINEVETDYGRDLSVSSAGAEGWMQFLPSSWSIYGVDANGDGFKDPYNPADAIFAAARYLRAAGAAADLPGAIFAYNHSRAYVESVLLRARLLGGTPSELLGAITGLTQARFPVHAAAHFSDGFPLAPAGTGSSRTIPGTTIYSEAGAPVIAVQDGRVAAVGASRELGQFVSLRDAYGNTYTYAQLGSIARYYPVLRPHEAAPRRTASAGGEPAEPRPSGPASAGTQLRAPAAPAEGAGIAGLSSGPGAPLETQAGASAQPGVSAAQSGLGTPGAAPSAQASQPQAQPSQGAAPGSVPAAGSPTPAGATPLVFRAGPNDVYLHRMHPGASVIAGTILGHLGGAAARSGEAPHVLFQIRPAGEGAPLIDPKPILDGWVALENTSVYRARGANPYLATAPTPGQVLLESKRQLEQQVLANADIRIYRCGRQDIAGGQIDRRVLATLEFLAVSGLRPSVSALQCPGSQAGAESVLAHGAGEAVDISAVNGVELAGHQGAGSLADETVRRLLTMQGPMRPRQIISLMRYPGASNTHARADHADRVEVSFYSPPLTLNAHSAGVLAGAVSPAEWIRLIARLGEIPNPAVRSGHSAAAIPVGASTGAGEGEANGHG